MQSRTLKRILLIFSPSATLLVLAILGIMENPVFNGLTRATIALVVLAYLIGVLATFWALQLLIQKASLVQSQPKN